MEGAPKLGQAADIVTALVSSFMSPLSNHIWGLEARLQSCLFPMPNFARWYLGRIMLSSEFENRRPL